MRSRILTLVVVFALGGFAVVKVARTGASSAQPDNSFWVNSSSSIAPAADSAYVRQLPVTANDMVFDKTSGKLYASVPSRSGAMGNSIARINPLTGIVEGVVFIGSEPGKLALADDGQTLYVSLDGAGAIRRYDLTTQTAGAQFVVGENTTTGPLFVIDMAVAPGNPNLLAVSRKNVTASPNFEGVAAYDSGVQRPGTTATHTGSDFIAFSSSASLLYGFGVGGGTMERLNVGSSGVSLLNSKPLTALAGDFKVDQGLMYMPFGQVFNPETGVLLATFAVPGGGLSQVEPDSSVGRVYFLTGTQPFDDTTARTLTLRAFDQNTFVPLGTIDVPNIRGRITNLVRWGANGLAFGTSVGSFYLIQTTLVPSSEPVPTPTPTPSPTATPSPTPTPTPAPGDLREVTLTAKDIVINPTTQTAYASVPSSVGSSGNSITPFDAISGAVGQPVFVGSEPNKLAISDNGQFIYVGLDGARALRRFDVASATAGLQFSVGGNTQGQFVPVDIAVAPGQPQTVAVVRSIPQNSVPNNGDGGVALYDDGVQRSNTTTISNTINVIRYSASPLVFYGQNLTNSEGGFRRLAATSCGVSILAIHTKLLNGPANFQVEDGLAYATSGRVVDPENGRIVGTYPLFSDVQTDPVTAVLADAKSRRVYFFSVPLANPSPGTMLVRSYDMSTFLLVGALAVPNIVGSPTTVLRSGTDGFAFRTTGDKVYLLRTSLIQPPLQPPPLPSPIPTPPTYTLLGQVAISSGTPPPVTVRLSGGQTGSAISNSLGRFTFTGLPFCTDFTVTPDPIENYTFSPASVTVNPSNQTNPNFAAATFNLLPKQIGFSPGTSVSLTEGGTATLTVRRFNDLSTAATVVYQTGGGTASDRSDYIATFGTLRFAPGESTKQVTVFTTDDVRDESNETFTLTLSNPTGAFLGTQPTLVVTILDNDATDGSINPADDAQFFVRQHYQDFLNRNPDASGLAFWANQITSCGADTQCTEVRRINVSAAFFLSIEFQETGYLVYKANQASFNFGEQFDLQSFLSDTQEIGRGVVIGQPGADAQLEANKQKFFLDFVQRPAFLAPGAYPVTLTAGQFVDKLNGNTFDPLNPSGGPALTPGQRDALVAQLTADPTSPTVRAQVLRSVSENAVFTQRQSNKAFVLMQYFGYLRRNPNSIPDSDFAGYNFWLGKLNQFGGNFVQAEMVKAFITSAEYRSRFGP